MPLLSDLNSVTRGLLEPRVQRVDRTPGRGTATGFPSGWGDRKRLPHRSYWARGAGRSGLYPGSLSPPSPRTPQPRATYLRCSGQPRKRT